MIDHKHDHKGCLQNGSLVKVKKAYVGSGRYESDGNEGLYTVLAYFGQNDYYLARGDCRHNYAIYMWDLISHVTRIEVVK